MQPDSDYPHHAPVPYPVPLARAEAPIRELAEKVTEMSLLAAALRDKQRLTPPRSPISVRFLSGDLGAQIQTVWEAYAALSATIQQALNGLEGSLTELTLLREGAARLGPQDAEMQAAFLAALKASQSQAEAACATLREVEDVRTHQVIFLLAAVQGDAAQGNTERQRRHVGGKNSGKIRRANSPAEIYRARALELARQHPLMSGRSLSRLMARETGQSAEAIRRAIRPLFSRRNRPGQS